MYFFAWMVVRLLLVDSTEPAPALTPERAGQPAPDFTGMAVSLANRLSDRLTRGEITRVQYRRGIEALAVADARRQSITEPRL